MAESPTPLEIAKTLHEEADQIIHCRGIDKILQSCGEVFYTGSYFLDAMAWPDIDITIAMEPDPSSVEDFFQIGTKIAKIDGMMSLKFNNFFRLKVQNLPEGLYWGIRLDAGNRDMPWKIDLWARDKEALAENRTEMEQISQMMDAETRKLIIEVKHSLLTPEGRTPVLSGYKIYEAVFYEGLRKKEDIVAYLKERGIEI